MGSLTHDLHKLPVIYLNKNNIDPNSSSWVRTREDVVRALEDYGCFIANFDKLSEELYEAIFRASQEFFDLPNETKVLTSSEYLGRGYGGKQPNIPLYENLNIPNATTLEGIQEITHSLWPNGNYSFSETALSFSKIIAELYELVMRMVSEVYGIEKEYEWLNGSTAYLLKLMKYRVPQENEENVGLSPHTDSSFITILLQHRVNGLEMKTQDGEWMLIEPSHDSSFIVMAGDACMAWTNGRIKPPYHRVIMNGKEERYSVGVFTTIKNLTIEVPEALVDDEHPLQYKPFHHYKYLEYFFTEEAKRSKCAIKSYCGV